MTVFTTSSSNVSSGQFVPKDDAVVFANQQQEDFSQFVEDNSSGIFSSIGEAVGGFVSDFVADPVDTIGFQNSAAELVVLQDSAITQSQPSGVVFSNLEQVQQSGLAQFSDIDAGLLAAGGIVFSTVALAAILRRK